MPDLVTRKEVFLKDISDGNSVPTLTPITSKEKAMAAMITGVTNDVVPMTRKAKAYLEIAEAKSENSEP